MHIDGTNDGPSSKFEKKEEIKLVLDMSNDGPMFKMLESMLSGGGGKDGAFGALQKLLQSGIPGLENLFGKDADGSLKFNKMSDEDKKRFIEAVTGAGGKIDSKAAAALIAAAASGGDPEIANKIIEKMMSGLGDEIDPAMMSALMATTALVAAGASNEEILAAMQRELAASGLSPEEILAKTLLLQKAMAGDNSPAFINKTLKNALNVANLNQEDLAKVLYIEKALAASGASPEDIAKVLLIQSALKAKGVPSDVIAAALNKIIKNSGNQKELLDAVTNSLKNDDVSIEEITKVLAMNKALDGGKIRGLKDLQQILEESSTDSIDGIEDTLEKIFNSGVLSPESVSQSLVFQKAMSSSGVNPDNIARAMLLQKSMAESGMAIHEVANAMSLAMTLDPHSEKAMKQLKEDLKDCLERGLTAGDIDIICAFREAMEKGEIPKEAINLMRKAMKQRRGSVDNVAETLMASLAASGQSKESIAKAMVKALQATGATPEEIAKTMQQAMAKSGATQEEICKAMASAMAASGASAEDIAAALKENFAKAMAADPSAAADIARAMAVALASAGASAEDIARTMQEALAASVAGGGSTNAEDLLEIAQTVARAMAEAGASPEDIQAAMKNAIASAGAVDNPELMAELTKTMAKAMADAGASGEEIARAMHEALAASGASEEEIAQSMLEAMAASGANPETIAKTMQAALENSGLAPEEIQKRVIEAMVESGASAEEIAKTIVQQNLLNAIGCSPDDISRQLLSELRSGKDITVKSIEAILQRGGIDQATAAKVLMFQKALAAISDNPEDIVKAILLQKAWLNGYGNAPENIVKVLEDIMAEADGDVIQKNLIELILNKITSDDMSCDDIMKAIMFNNAFDTNGASVNNIKDMVNKAYKNKNFDNKELSQAMQELLCNNGATADSIIKTAVLQKLLSGLGVSPDDVAKLFGLQKSMYDSGASPQDVAMLMEMILGAGHVDLEDLEAFLRKDLEKKLKPADIINIVEVVDAFQGTKIPPELISKIMLMQKAIESDISSPELSSQELANKLKRPNVNAEGLAPDLLELLKKNGLSVDSLEKSVLIQKVTTACAMTPRELAIILDLQNKMFEAGRSADEVAMAFREVIGKSGIDMKDIAQSLLNALEQGKIKNEEIMTGAFIFDAIMNNGIDSKHDGAAVILKELKGNLSQNDIINIVRKALDASKIRVENLLKVILLQKVLAASESEPADLAKIVRIENAILRSGVSVDGLCRTINEAVKPRNKSILEKLKRPLLDVINSGTVSVTGQEVSFTQDYQTAMKSNVQADENKLKEVFDNAMAAAGLSKEDVAKALLVQKTLAASGITPEILAQVVMFQKALAASGISPAEIADILNKAIAEDMSEDAVSDLVKSMMEKKGCSKEEIEKVIQLQKSLSGGMLGGGDKLNCNLSDLFSSGKVDANLLQKALLMQKILSASGLSPEDLGKAFLLQNAMIEAGASPENVANCMHRTLIESGISLEHLITLMEIELKAAMAKGLTPTDVVKFLQFEKIMGAGSSAKRIMRRINPEALRLMEATVKKQVPGKPGSNDLMEAMKGCLGTVLDTSVLQAMEVSAAMAGAGASKEEIEEMMQMILNKGGGISDDFIDAIKDAMAAGGSPFDKLNALKTAMEEEMNSVTNALRNTFINRVPTTEEIANSCKALAEKLCADAAARTDVKLALVDVLDEALQDVMEYEPDADMIFNYLMVSALAAATDFVEREGLRPTGGDLQELARKEMLDLIERLLLEADLESEIPKLDVYGKTIDGIKELLKYLLLDPNTGKQLKRQVAFLFDFEDIEHTTVLGLTLQDIIKDAKHRLRPWELEKKRRIRGLKKALVPNLGYSQIYCYYRVLPEHLEGPPIGLSYE